MKSLENTMDFPLFQETNYVMVIKHFTQRTGLSATEMLCSWPSLPRRFRSDHPGTWKLWQGSKAQGGSMEIVDNSINIMVWHYVIQYDTIWYQYGMIWYDIMYIIWYDMLWRQIMCNRKQCVYNLVKKKYQICKCNVSVHASTALHQKHNLCTSHHVTILSGHILQLTLFASICETMAVM